SLSVEYTPIGAVTAVNQPAGARASAYGLESILVDGNDADAMLDVARSTIGRARDGEGPSLVEAVTYRHGGHSRADPAKYRPESEVQEWFARDPVLLYRTVLEAAGAPAEMLTAIEADADREVDESTEITTAAPRPSLSMIAWDVGSNGRSARPT